MTFGTACMKGFLFVDTAALTNKALEKWIALSLAHNATQPAKKAIVNATKSGTRSAKAPMKAACR